MNTFRLSLLCFFIFTISNPAFSTVFYVNQNVSGGTQDGLTWENAFSNLQSALQQAERGDEIWVAQGTYFPTNNPFRKITFTLPEGVALFGGFNGTELNRSERDWTLNETILSGDIGVVGDSLDNSHTVLYIGVEESDSTRVVDGLIIQDGNANSEDANDFYLDKEKCGGGMFVEGVSSDSVATPRVRNCVFRFNYGLRGGGIFLRGVEIPKGAGHLILEDCLFLKNSARSGGGFHCSGSGKTFDIELKRCKFVENRGDSDGGAIEYHNKSENNKNLILIDCLFERNVASASGAAINFEKDESQSGLKVINCLFLKNQLPINGEGNVLSVFFDANSNNNQGDIFFENCLFQENNNAGSCFSFGSISLGQFGDIFFTNCKFIRNENYDLFLFIDGTSGNFKNCLFLENKTAGGQIVLIDGSEELFLDLKFINCSILFNEGYNPNLTDGIIYSLNEDEINLTIRNSIIWGNSKSGDNKLLNLNGIGSFYIENSLLDVTDCSEINNSLPNICSNNLYNLPPNFLDTLNNDYRLAPCSPAINAGNNDFLDPTLTFDLDSQPRIQDNIVDIGAYEAAAIEISIDTIVGVTCEEGTSGAVHFSLENTCEPLTFNWTNNNLSGTGNTGLAAGNYQFTVTDANNRTATILANIEATPINFDLEIMSNPILCTEGIGGQAAALPTGGTAPFSYFWNNGSTDSLLQNLPQGSYQLTITDANGCSATAQTLVENEGLLGLGINVSPVSCHDSADGTAAVSPIGGQAPFTYLWAGGETDSLLNNLSGGAYSVTVADVFGCEDVLDFSMIPPDSLGVELMGTDAFCFGENTGMATAIPTGGTTPYDYLWSDFSIQPAIGNLAAGSYQLTVTDANDCQQIANLTIAEPTELTATFAVDSIGCYGGNTGEIAAAATGNAPFSYSWNNGIMDSLLTNLSAGDYDLTITDANNCTLLESFTLSQPDDIEIDFQLTNASSATAMDGTIEFSILSGGTPPFSYFWNTNDTTANVENLAAGEYLLTVTDDNGCERYYSFEVSFLDANQEASKALIYKIYPNPATDFLTIELANKDVSTVNIYNSLGQLVLEKTFNSLENQVDIEIGDLAAGVYWIEILTKNEKIASGRFLKK